MKPSQLCDHANLLFGHIHPSLLSKFHGVPFGTTPYHASSNGVRMDSFLSQFADTIHGVVPNGTPYGVILTPWNLESSCLTKDLRGRKVDRAS
jgi:hypothetical protein